MMEPQMNADTFEATTSCGLINAKRNLISGSIGGAAPDDSFPAKFGKFEVEKKRQLQLGDRKVTQHLRDVLISECFNHLRINDHFFINQDIRNQRADQMAAIVDRKAPLLLDVMTLGDQFEHERVLINPFVEARLQSVKHFHSSANYRRAEFALWIFVFHSRRIEPLLGKWRR